MLFYFCRFLLRVYLRLFHRLEPVGAENVPEEGGYLLVANHASFLDPPIVGCPLRRRMHSLAKSELFKIFLFGPLIHAVHAHPVHRGAPDRAAIRTCAELMCSGQLLVIFPEGTRTRDGHLQRAKPGVGMIASRAGAPCIPAYIDGAFRCWPRTRLLPRPGKIRIYYGKPFALPAQDEGKPSKEYYQQCADEMMRKIDELRPKQ